MLKTSDLHFRAGLWLLLVLMGTVHAAEPARGMKLVQAENAIDILIDGQPLTTFRSSPGQAKPYFWPLRAADGTAVVRPLTEIPKGDDDHPHHKGLWWSLDEVNHQNFWAEKSRVENRQVSIVEDTPERSVLRMTNAWIHQSGTAIVQDVTTVTVTPDRLMVFEIQLSTLGDTVECHDTKEGFLALRVETTMRGTVGGKITDSMGHADEAGCWGKAATWVDYSGPIGGQNYGVSLFDHPQNFRPARYHVRAYGLFAISPFGEHSYQKKAEKAAPVLLKPNAPLTLRYGVYVHTGTAEEGQVAAMYERFLATP